MSGKSQLTVLQLDVLREIGNIGLGNAATSLATLLNQRIDMEVPKAGFIGIEELINTVGGPEEVVACVNMQLIGDIPGVILFIFNEKSAFNMIDMMLCLDRGTTIELDEMGQSVVSEVGNILTGAFVGAIGQMAQLSMNTKVPLFAFDMLGAILTTGLIAGGYGVEDNDNILYIETVLSQKQDDIKGQFFLLTEPEYIRKVFDVLGIAV